MVDCLRILQNRYVLILCILLLLLSRTGHVNADEFRIGVLAARGAEATVKMWQPTANYLTNNISGQRFSVVPVTHSNLEEKLAAKELQFVLTNPALYATLENTQGLSPIATLKTKRLGESYTEFGAVIFTRTDRHDLGSLNDLEGKSFIAVHPRAFGGWWMALYEFRKKGIEPTQFLSEIRWSGFPEENIVFDVLNGHVDAGTVRTNTLERLAFHGKIKLSDVRVLNAKSEPGFPFLLSTPLYPEWTFAKVKDVSAEVADQVAISLLSLSGDSVEAAAAESDGWTLPLNYEPVHTLIHELRMGQHKNYINVTQVGISDLNPNAWLITLLGFLLVNGYWLLRVRHFKNAKKGLQNQVNAHVDNKFDAIEDVERRNIYFGKLSSIIHSLKLSPSDKLQQLLMLACGLLNVEQGSIEKVDHIAGKYLAVGQVLRDDKYTNIINHDSYAAAKKELISQAFAADKIICSPMHESVGSDNHVSGSQAGIKIYFGSNIYVDGQKYGVLSLIGVSTNTFRLEVYEKDSWEMRHLQHISYLLGQLIEKEMLMQRISAMHEREGRYRAG